MVEHTFFGGCPRKKSRIHELSESKRGERGTILSVFVLLRIFSDKNRVYGINETVANGFSYLCGNYANCVW